MGSSSTHALYGVLLTVLAIVAASTSQHEAFHKRHNTPRAATGPPMVFAHYMISYQPPNLNYTTDMLLAKNAGIDAFAVNYGGWSASWPYFEHYLNVMYTTAEKLGFKLFLCMDTTSVPNAAMVVNLTNFYADNPAQAKDAHGHIFLSSFETGPPPWNWQTDVINHIKVPVTFLPGTLSQDAEYTLSQNQGFGPFTWIHPACNATGEGAIDTQYTDMRNSNGAPWMAGVAPWFFKRLSPSMNWLHAQDSYMWIDRWMNLLKLKPNYIEIITWNDFGESSYIGPRDPTPAATLANPSTPGYYGNLDHSGFLKMAALFIKAFKAGEEQVTVSSNEEDVFMFYRIQPAGTLGLTDTMPLPENVSSIEDNVYVVPFLSSEATVSLNSGGKPWSMDAPAGVSKGTFGPFTWGNQILTASRPINGQTLHKQGPPIVGHLPRYQGNVVSI
ncbi:hypothetical protein ACLMJK_003659 [Lecanora helva]